jgi:hypothetical protein
VEQRVEFAFAKALSSFYILFTLPVISHKSLRPMPLSPVRLHCSTSYILFLFLTTLVFLLAIVRSTGVISVTVATALFAYLTYSLFDAFMYCVIVNAEGKLTEYRFGLLVAAIDLVAVDRVDAAEAASIAGVFNLNFGNWRTVRLDLAAPSHHSWWSRLPSSLFSNHRARAPSGWTPLFPIDYPPLLILLRAAQSGVRIDPTLLL